MASIASLVPKLRPTLAGFVLLLVTVLALRDGQHAHDCGRRHVSIASLEGPSGRAPLTLRLPAEELLHLDPWDRPPRGTAELIAPPAHADARPWPQGMVIAPPAIDSAIVLWDHSPLDTMLSAFVEALRALDS